MGTSMASGYYRVELRIPFKDVDEYKIVWYGNYLAYFDIARTELLREFGLPPSQWSLLGFYAPVISAKVNYHSPARNDEEIVVEVRPKVFRIAQISFLFRILRKEDECLLVTGETTHVLKNMDDVLLYMVPSVLTETIEAILRDLGEI